MSHPCSPLRRRLSRSILAAALVGAAACDLVVTPGQTTVLGNGGTVFGSSGSRADDVRPAVRVRQGNLIVQDASVLGGSAILSVFLGASRFEAAPGIDASRGNVLLERGAFVRGGVAVPQSRIDVTLVAGPGIPSPDARRGAPA